MSNQTLRGNSLTPAQIKRRAQFAAILTPRPLSAFNVPINTGPLNVRRGTGVNASI